MLSSVSSRKKYFSLAIRLFVTRGLTLSQILLATFFIPSDVYGFYSIYLSFVSLSLFNVNNILDQSFLCSRLVSFNFLNLVYTAKLFSSLFQCIVYFILIFLFSPDLPLHTSPLSFLVQAFVFIPILDALISPGVLYSNKHFNYSQTNILYFLSSLGEISIFLGFFLVDQPYYALFVSLFSRYVLRF